MKDFSGLLAIGIPGAAFFISLWAGLMARRAAEYLKECRKLLSAPGEPDDSSRKRMEKRFDEGLQNIYNYGGNVAKLTVEDICHE